jgi:hypothetical protein
VLLPSKTQQHTTRTTTMLVTTWQQRSADRIVAAAAIQYILSHRRRRRSSRRFTGRWMQRKRKRVRSTVHDVHEMLGPYFFKRAYRMSYESFIVLTHELKPFMRERNFCRAIINGPIDTHTTNISILHIPTYYYGSRQKRFIQSAAWNRHVPKSTYAKNTSRSEKCIRQYVVPSFLVCFCLGFVHAPIECGLTNSRGTHAWSRRNL